MRRKVAAYESRVYIYQLQNLYRSLMKNSAVLVACGIFALAIISIPILLYYRQFGHLGLSEEQTVWGAFGDFLNVWVSSASLILLSGLTFYLNFSDRKRQEDYQRLEDSRNRPYLICKLDDNAKWKIRNVGNGPALNIRYSFEMEDGEFKVPTKMHSLISGEDFYFPWGDPDISKFKLAIVYYDIHKKVISTYYENEDSQILEGENLLKDFDTNNYVSIYMIRRILSFYNK